MCTKWNRFTFKAIMLALLSLIFFGCGGGTSTSVPSLRTVNGVVSDSTGGQPFANAAVTAYAIDAAGNVATTPLSATVQSDGQGNFALKIPQSYAGGIKLVATETTGAGSTVLNSVLSSVSQGQTAVISPATDLVYQYVVTNNGTSGFTSENIRQATLVLEPFLGQNFNQSPPPALGSAPTPAQQQLIVVTQAINSLVTPTTTLADLVEINPATGIMNLGEGTVFTDLNAAIGTISANQVTAGVIPGSFEPPNIIPMPEPDLTDVTQPSAPQNFTATSTTSSVTLFWDAASDNVGVTDYYVYRNNGFVNTVPASTRTYTDSAVTAGTSYSYEVKARDAAGNVSTGSTVNVATPPILTYTISGKITNGSGLSSVFVAISGSGSGVVLSDAAGNYTFTGVRAGSYTVTPALGGYAFTPASRPAVVTSANITGIDFTAEIVSPGTVTGSTTYPDGTVITTTTYPDGTVTTTIHYANGMVTVSTTYPSGTVTTTTTYPNGTVSTSTTYPNGTVIGGVTYPAGTVISSVTYPNGTIIGGVTYPAGTVIGSVTYPNGTVTGGVTYPSGTVIGGVSYPAGTVIGGVVYSNGAVIGGATYPSGAITPLFGDSTYVIVSGRISNAGVGLKDVLVTITPAAGVPVTGLTGPLGYYYISVVSGGTYTITPTLSSYTFDPSTAMPIPLITNINGQDFVNSAL